MTRISLTTRKRQRKSQNPEDRAVQILHALIYGGAGQKFLGWGLGDKVLLPDGTLKKVGKDGWRFWTIPTDTDRRRWWNPIWDHLKSEHRGVVAINASTVPFITVDLDRHNAQLLARDHILRVLKSGRLLKRHFPELSWSAVEVNQKNGSAKLYGLTGKPIPCDTAIELGSRIHEFLVEHGIGDHEVFPFNSVQVGLPMRADKTTVVSSGILGKCLRKKKVDGKMVPFEAYSTVAFVDAIQSRSCYDEDTVHRVLKTACANLPDQPAPQTSETARTSSASWIEPLQFSSAKSIHIHKGLSVNEDEPNSFSRQLRALLGLARRLRYVPSEVEALSFLKENRLFSGDWSDNESRRRNRVRWIVRHIAKTFNPTKNKRMKVEVRVGKFDSWARAHVGTLRDKVRRYLDEYGNIYEVQGRTAVDWRFVSVMLSVVEFCFNNPNSDQSLSEKTAEKIWGSCLEAKLTNVKWNGHKWAITRDWLNQIGVIDVFDRSWHFNNGRGQAMRWRPTDKFHELHVWYKSKWKSPVDGSASIESYIERKHHTPPLNYYRNTKPLLTPFRPEDWRCRAPPSRQSVPKTITTCKIAILRRENTEMARHPPLTSRSILL